MNNFTLFFSSSIWLFVSFVLFENPSQLILAHGDLAIWGEREIIWTNHSHFAPGQHFCTILNQQLVTIFIMHDVLHGLLQLYQRFLKYTMWCVTYFPENMAGQDPDFLSFLSPLSPYLFLNSRKRFGMAGYQTHYDILFLLRCSPSVNFKRMARVPTKTRAEQAKKPVGHVRHL